MCTYIASRFWVLLDLVRKLCDYAAAERICHSKDVKMYRIIILDVVRIFPLQAIYGFLKRLIKMGLHGILHGGELPVFAVRATEKCGNRIGIVVPLFARGIDFGFVAGFGGSEQIRCAEDMVLQQHRQFIASIVTVVWLDGIPNVRLICEQSLGGRVFIG